MTVDTAGKIGIDTTTPTVLFDISNRIRAQWDTPIYGIGIAAA